VTYHRGKPALKSLWGLLTRSKKSGVHFQQGETDKMRGKKKKPGPAGWFMGGGKNQREGQETPVVSRKRKGMPLGNPSGSPTIVKKIKQQCSTGGERCKK